MVGILYKKDDVMIEENFKKTIKEWVLETQSPDDIKNIVEHGCVNGACSELIYYSDTIKFYDNFSDQIWNMLEEYSKDFGAKKILDYLSSYINYKYDSSVNINNDTTFKNSLAWWSVEKTCQKIFYDKEDK